MSVFWISQRQKLVDAGLADAADTSELRQQARELEDRCNKALLVTEALWTLLRDRLGVSEEELLARVREIDLRDGTLDGVAARPPAKCAACGRLTAASRSRCLYCGDPLPPAGVF